MLYRYIYKTGVEGTKLGNIYSKLLRIFASKDISLSKTNKENKINIAIVGAGRTGASLYDSIESNPASIYNAMFFIDKDNKKYNKKLKGLYVYPYNKEIYKLLDAFNVKEVVIAIPELHKEEREELFEFYKKSNCKVKMYDFSSAVPASTQNQIRDFDIEDLLPRKIKNFDSSEYNGYFKDKVILVTGAGGSIGSALSRQIASMNPKNLILLDIYENGVYDLQQDLLLKHKNNLKLDVEIATVTNKLLLDKIFKNINRILSYTLLRTNMCL